jgi:hypothetical protein
MKAKNKVVIFPISRECAANFFEKDMTVKSVTEFPKFTLVQGLAKKAALDAEGKSPEETLASLGEAFKYEGDKAKFFLAAIEVAKANETDLKRVLVVTLAEGESVPSKGVKVEEHYFIPDFHVVQSFKQPAKKDSKGGGGRGGSKGGGAGKPKESPWGISPEEKAAKAAKSLASQQAAAAKKAASATK